MGGSLRSILPANWKFAMDNSSGDAYHGYVTHGSARLISVRGNSPAPVADVFAGSPDRATVHAGNGHGITTTYMGSELNKQFVNSRDSVVKRCNMEHLAELDQRLGPPRSRQVTPNTTNVFPNFTSCLGGSQTLRIWHPRGPKRTEMWSFCLVDKDAPQEVKDALRKDHMLTFSPGGLQEQDDMNNWQQCTEAASSPIGRKYLMNQAMGLGHERRSEIVPGVLSHQPSETNQRALYGRWAEIMDAPSWDQIHLDPKTKF